MKRGLDYAFTFIVWLYFVYRYIENEPISERGNALVLVGLFGLPIYFGWQVYKNSKK